MELKKMRDQILDDFRRMSPDAVSPEDREVFNRGWKAAMCAAWIIVKSVFDEAVDRRTIHHDPVNHPAHYTSGSIEVIDYIEDQKLPYHLGNAVKYISRAGKKDPEKTAEDLKKAVWYLNRYIRKLEYEKEALAWTE